jgi:putative ABC transport system ATP-binding protein
MLEVNQLTKIYIKNGQSFTAINKVSFQIEKGEFVAVVGPSGSGKSTLLHSIGGLIRPNSGKVLFHGKDVYSFNSKEANKFRNKKVGFVFQQFHLMPYLTVFENIMLAGGKTSDKNSIADYLQKCSLSSLKNKYPSELSVGEKQRAAFIRAIVSEPELLLADEPTGNLDPENGKILMSLVENYHKKGGSVILVTHQAETAKFAKRTITLRAGEII